MLDGVQAPHAELGLQEGWLPKAMIPLLKPRMKFHLGSVLWPLSSTESQQSELLRYKNLQIFVGIRSFGIDSCCQRQVSIPLGI